MKRINVVFLFGLCPIVITRSFTAFEFFFSISLYLIYLKLIDLVFPVIFIALSPYLYLLCFSYILYFCFDEYGKTKHPILLIRYSFLFFVLSFVRELLAFGSLSLPSFYGIASFNIFELLGFTAPFRFLGSVAGSLVLLGFIASFYIWYSNDEQMYVKEKN